MRYTYITFLFITNLAINSSLAFGQVTYPLTDTGQTKCYNLSNEINCPKEGEEFYGQDAQFLTNPPSFSSNEDGTVRDEVTGLLWQKFPSEQRMSWTDAQDYCKTLELAGRDDWRTPNLKELFGISDFTQGWPYIDDSVFYLSGSGKDQQFWASNFYKVGTTHGGAYSAFGVNHSTGHIKAYPADPPKNKKHIFGKHPNFGKLVRCVAGDEIGKNLFKNNNDGTITDLATGLMWSRTDAGKDMEWKDALKHAVQMNANNYLGYSDWRLPNIRELQSIVDYSGSFPAIEAKYFVWSEADRYYWSSTSAYFNSNNSKRYYAWYVAFGYAPGPNGEDVHGAGAVRFIGKSENSPHAEGDYRPMNSVRLVRTLN